MLYSTTLTLSFKNFCYTFSIKEIVQTADDPQQINLDSQCPVVELLLFKLAANNTVCFQTQNLIKVVFCCKFAASSA